MRRLIRSKPPAEYNNKSPIKTSLLVFKLLNLTQTTHEDSIMKKKRRSQSTKHELTSKKDDYFYHDRQNSNLQTVKKNSIPYISDIRSAESLSDKEELN